jgi:uncharacterized membrane protein
MNGSKENVCEAVAFPLLALLVVSAACAVFLGLRIAWTGSWAYLSLAWNLFLAWLPLLFAIGACREYRKRERGGWRVCALAALWLLFLPNAPYIFTDLIHLNNWYRGHYWVDLSLVLLISLTGFLVGFLSLFLMQRVIADRLGRIASWLFVVVVAGLSGYGVFVGRVMRRNSWDVFVHPVGLTRDIGHWAAHPLVHPGVSLGFPVLFGAFLLLAYIMLYALTHLQPGTLTRDLKP